jgi:hypothetical protein
VTGRHPSMEKPPTILPLGEGDWEPPAVQKVQ